MTATTMLHISTPKNTSQIYRTCYVLLGRHGRYEQTAARIGCRLYSPFDGESLFLRRYHTSLKQRQEAKSSPQVHPLGDFYADLLAVPIPQNSKAHTELPAFVDTGGDLTKEERAARLFGSIKGSGYERKIPQAPESTWRTINGVPIPPRPEEPENCCMSGCVHCVWDDYRDDIEEWAARLHEAQAKGTGQSEQVTPKLEMSRPEISNASVSMDDDGGGSESLWASPNIPTEGEDLFSGIPVGIREFMATEKRIRERKKTRSSG